MVSFEFRADRASDRGGRGYKRRGRGRGARTRPTNIYHHTEGHELFYMTHSPQSESPKDDQPADRTHGIAKIHTILSPQATSGRQLAPKGSPIPQISGEAGAHMSRYCSHVANKRQHHHYAPHFPHSLEGPGISIPLRNKHASIHHKQLCKKQRQFK